MAENKKLVPKRRFKEFQNAEAWEQCKLSELLDLLTDFDANGSFESMAKNVTTYDGQGYAWYVRMTDLENNTPISNVKYVDKSSYDFLKKTHLHGGELLMAKRGDIGKVYVFNALTTYATLAPNMYLLKLNKKVIPNFLYNFFITDDGNGKLKKINASTTMGALYKDDVKNIDVILPCLKEQENTSEFFTNLDNLITLHQRKLDKIKSMKKAYLSEMFPAEGESKPKRRFKGFSGDWELRKLGEVVDLCSGRDYKHLSKGDIPVYGTGGYMLSVNDALSYDKDAIGIGRKGTIDKPYILKSPFWTVDTLFYAIPIELNHIKFLYGVFQNIDWRQKDESTGVPSLSKVVINNTNVLIPSIEEQKKIGEHFENLDNLIILNQNKLDKLKNLKKSYLNEMFI